MESPIQTNSKPDSLFSYWLAQFEFVKENNPSKPSNMPDYCIFLKIRLVLIFRVRLGDSKPLSEEVLKTRFPFDGLGLRGKSAFKGLPHQLNFTDT
jgi:hypothetical protein